ncbi:OmpA family protein [Thiohalobacter thiocyanaticus]|uniref:DUF4398 domain-containing protein n=1 Tax=Thiohalobacter thiocyanaticus TaxID=585455 RepID=A0A426QHX5_9GAMM|nr:OmpA family protein [Thiohalobacter thiocyanaticus]RRQ21340.1 DUF4398 domain-containing protein [Thiohalobacter thiocyanaticus]
MKTFTTQYIKHGTVFAGLAFLSLVITSCAVAPASPEGATQVRSKLTALQNDPDLADRARVEIREAEAAVRIAEQPLPEADAALASHRLYIADRKVAIAEARAATRYAEDQRAQLGEERDEARLEARTREVGKARADASRARSAAEAAQISEQEGVAVAARQAEEYQRRIDALQAEITDRGVVLTLGDVLFATGSAELQAGANSNLNKLVNFLRQYPERRVQIEGHTDNVGSTEYNQGLSQRRADSVRYYLEQQGIASQRLSASGIGMDRPVANNDTATGRQQNRRVEIVIENPQP